MPGACNACIFDRQCHPDDSPCWCCPWPSVDRACKAAIRAYRAGDSRTYATALIRLAADKAEVAW